ncbi:MAG: DUF2927 domain-containing protein [Deltaproteobacteria bacterium]|nr:DUF2927 domain-containing protein [Deltaproteobacteria bacterium]
MPHGQAKQWALQVLLGPEFGGAGKVCSRFARPVTVSVMRGTAAERVHLLQWVPLLDQQLRAAGSSLTLLADGDGNAAIEVHFVNHAEFDAIGKAKGFPVHGGNFGYFWTFWDDSHRITKAHVLIAKDKLSGAKLRHFTFEELTQSLGLSNDSAVFGDSIFYANGAHGGSAPTLSALDQKLVRFYYRHVAPGSQKPQLEAAFDALWASTP